MAHRTPRTRALEIGTDPGKFGKESAYDHRGGFPVGTPGQGGEYRDSADAAKPVAGPTSHNPPSPFK